VIPDCADKGARPLSCEGGGEGYWEARLKRNWGLHGVGHIGYGRQYNRWLYRVRRRVFTREVGRLSCVWAQWDILDVGSGTGFWIDTWKALGVRSVTGSDVTQVAVDRLRQMYPDLRFARLDISGSLESQNFAGTFNAVSAFDVLFHITSDVGFVNSIANIYKLLMPGGYFIFSDNFLHRPEIRSDHQVSRSLEEVCEVLSGTGFRIVRRVPMFVLMNTPVDSSSLWAVRFWRLAMLPVRLFRSLGSLYGAALYPLELCLTRLVRESPTTEMMICQKAPTT
jgi:SAM-dependent methyltransferase